MGGYSGTKNLLETICESDVHKRSTVSRTISCFVTLHFVRHDRTFVILNGVARSEPTSRLASKRLPFLA